MTSVIILAGFLGLVAVVYLAIATVPSLRMRSTRWWAGVRLGAVSEGELADVDRARHGRAVATGVGGFAGVLAGAAVATAAELGPVGAPWAPVLGFVVGIATGQSLNAFAHAFRPVDGVRVAAATRTHVDSFVSPATRRLIAVGVGLALPSSGVTLALSLGAGYDLGSVPPGGLVLVTVLLLALGLLTVLGVRRLISLPVPAGSATQLRNRQAVRTEQVQDVVGALLPAAMAVASLAAGPVQDATSTWPAVVIGLQAVALLAVLILTGVVVGQQTLAARQRVQLPRPVTPDSRLR